MTAVAGAKTSSLASAGADAAVAMNGGFSAAFIGAAIIAFVAAAIAAIAISVPRPASARALAALLLFGLVVVACNKSDSHATHGEKSSAATSEHAGHAEAATPSPAATADASIAPADAAQQVAPADPSGDIADESKQPAKPVTARPATTATVLAQSIAVIMVTESAAGGLRVASCALRACLHEASAARRSRVPAS